MKIGDRVLTEYGEGVIKEEEFGYGFDSRFGIELDSPPFWNPNSEKNLFYIFESRLKEL